MKATLRHGLVYAGLGPFLVIALVPIVLMVVTAFKQEADLYRVGQSPFWFHLPPTLQNFRTLFAQTHFGTWLVNSLLLSVCVVAITVVAAAPAAYALARLRLPRARDIGIAIFVTYLVPPIVLFIPLARVVGELGLFDSWWALVVVYPTVTIPFCTWFLIGFFQALPLEIEEASWVDGCVITMIFAFTLSMQDFLYAVVYVAPRSEMTVTVGLATTLIRGDIFYWGSLMAAALLVSLPVVILYNFFLDDFIRGLTGR